MAKIDQKPSSCATSADMTSNAWLFGYFSSTGIAVCGAGARAHGIIGDQFVSGASEEVDFYTEPRKCKVMSGASFSQGAALTPNSSGQAVTATTGNIVSAIAMEAATAAN